MAVPYFRLIGIDRDRNEHPFEWPGLNAIDAAKKGAQRYGYTEVLSGESGQKRGNNGAAIYYKKLLFKDETVVPKDPDAKITLADLTVQRARKMAIPKLIELARAKGITFTLTEQPGKPAKLKIQPLAHCTAKKIEVDEIRDLARESMSLFIDVLQGEKEIPCKSPEPTAATDPLKGKTQSELVLQILPQMPAPFTLENFIERIRAAGYEDLAKQRARLQNAIQYSIKKGWVRRLAYARYDVMEEYRHRRANGEAPNKVATLPSDPIPLVVATPVNTPILDVSTMQVPQTLTEVPATMPSPPTLTMQSLVGTILDLASQAASDSTDPSLLADRLTEAYQQFESAMLDALSTLTSTVKPIVEQLKDQAITRKAIVRSLNTTETTPAACDA